MEFWEMEIWEMEILHSVSKESQEFFQFSLSKLASISVFSTKLGMFISTTTKLETIISAPFSHDLQRVATYQQEKGCMLTKAVLICNSHTRVDAPMSLCNVTQMYAGTVCFLFGSGNKLLMPMTQHKQDKSSRTVQPSFLVILICMLRSGLLGTISFCPKIQGLHLGKC
jgi:hypothetical protein